MKKIFLYKFRNSLYSRYDTQKVCFYRLKSAESSWNRIIPVLNRHEFRGNSEKDSVCNEERNLYMDKLRSKIPAGIFNWLDKNQVRVTAAIQLCMCVFAFSAAFRGDIKKAVKKRKKAAKKAAKKK